MPFHDASARRRRARGNVERGQLRTAAVMGVVVLGLHALGFLLLLLLAVHHRRLGASGGIAVGTGVTAYTLGLRHAFDADHISAIDSTTRKLMAEDQRPLTVGFFFSLGHSTVVLALALLLTVGLKALGREVTASGSTLHSVAGLIGTGLSGTFLYLIAALNLAVLWGIIKLLRDMRAGCLDETRFDERLRAHGPMGRVLGRFVRAVTKPWQMYPIGLMFGLGFDTATEVALLFLSAGAAGTSLPFYAVLCLPILFAAGMSLLDTIDGSFMNFAYGWAFSHPVRKVFYNLAVTGLSVAVALVIGTIELAGLLAQRLGARGSFWAWLEHVNVNILGFIIVGMFVATWALAAALWRVARIEQRWTAALDEGGTAG